jgi:hypothetical protein
MLGEILTVDGPVQAPQPDDGVREQHLHPKLNDEPASGSSGGRDGQLSADFKHSGRMNQSNE